MVRQSTENLKTHAVVTSGIPILIGDLLTPANGPQNSIDAVDRFLQSLLEKAVGLKNKMVGQQILQKTLYQVRSKKRFSAVKDHHRIAILGNILIELIKVVGDISGYCDQAATARGTIEVTFSGTHYTVKHSGGTDISLSIFF